MKPLVARMSEELAKASRLFYTRPMDTILTVREVAELLRVSRSTIYQLLKEQRIPAFRIGFDWRFNEQAIEQWVAKRGCADERPSNVRPVKRNSMLNLLT
jgi:excisionase family DNA binding protein